jgi:hypothetical protein
VNRSLAETVNHNPWAPLTTMLSHGEILLDQREVFPAGGRGADLAEYLDRGQRS